MNRRPLLLLQVHPSRANSARDIGALETTMQGLAIDERSPVALELAATATSRRFLLRADSPLGLHHLDRQIQARYPQALLCPASDDPLALAPGEECSVVELCPGAASYLPLRSWKPRDLLQEGADPLLGILAAFGELPKGTRAVAQLALLPASPTWSANSRRRAVEHPLAQERARESGKTGRDAPGGRMILFALLVLVLALLTRVYQSLKPHLPLWLVHAVSALVRGKDPHLMAWQVALLVGIAAGTLGGALLVTFAVTRLAARFGWGHTTIYDQRLVDEKTTRPAYCVRLRLYIIARGEDRTVGKLRWQEVWRWVRAGAYAVICAVWSFGIISLSTRVRGASRCLWQYRHAWRQNAGTHGWIKLGQLISTAWKSACTAARGRGHKLWKRMWAVFNQAGKLLVIWYRERRAATARKREREALLTMLTATYRQYHLASGGYFRPQRLSRRHARRLLNPTFGARGRRGFRRTGWAYDLPRSRHFLSIADIAALWHLPQTQDLADLSYIEPVMARTLLAPPTLTGGDGYHIGSSTHAGMTVPVVLPASCLRQNVLAVASTGKGKSTLLLHLALAYFLARLRRVQGIGGLVLVDFHGDLTQHVLGCIPEELQDAVVLIDLANRNFPVGINPLDLSQGQDRDKVVDNLLAIVEAIWSKSYGSRTENILEYALKTLAEANQSLLERDPVQGSARQFTVLDVVPLLRRTSFRHAIFEQVGDKLLVDWWKQYYELLDARQQAEYSSSTVTKLSKFASTRISRHILGQPRSTLNFAELIQHERIILINCASGEVGADAAALLGSFLMGLFQTTLGEQAKKRPGERHPYLVLIDEFQALTGIDYQTMLAELRKYGGSFGLATQSLAYLDRLDRTLRATVMANIEHLFAFAMAADDARLLHLDGVEPEDIANLSNYTCYARLARDGHRLPLFSLRLDAPPPTDEERQRLIAQTSQRRYGCPVGDVEKTLLAVQARQETMQPKRKRAASTGRTDAESHEQAEEGSPNQPVRRGGRPARTPKNETGQKRTPDQPPQPTALTSPEEAFPQCEQKSSIVSPPHDQPPMCTPTQEDASASERPEDLEKVGEEVTQHVPMPEERAEQKEREDRHA